MDNLTHGLLGLAVGALRRPRPSSDPTVERHTARATVVACILAAELPDLDTLWPAESEVLHALQAHRGWSHALVASPLVALIAAGIARAVFRRAELRPVYGFALLSVLVAHLLADAWTGWGTRLFLPFSDARATLDWTMVVDPLVTLPLLTGAVVAWRRRERWRYAMLVAAAVAAAYVTSRIVTRLLLLHTVREETPTAERIEVFPAPLDPLRWRFVRADGAQWVAGSVRPWGRPFIEARHPRGLPMLPQVVTLSPTVREALAWARLPLVSYRQREDGVHVTRVADLRYHWGGQPTLTFHIELGPSGEVLESRLDRALPGAAKGRPRD